VVHAYHVIWGAYGFWLPNDPRGSWSDFVYSWELARFGRATKSMERVEIAPPEYAAWRAAATKALKYPAISLSHQQVEAVADAMGAFVLKSGLCVWACSILPQHVHLVMRRHRYKIEQAANLLKGAAQRKLIEAGLHPLSAYRNRQGRIPSMWADKRWKVFLDRESAIENAIRYVEANPEREGNPRQNWPFVERFDGIIPGGWLTYH
jgi:REP element-mobilizing transposase RayT